MRYGSAAAAFGGVALFVSGALSPLRGQDVVDARASAARARSACAGDVGTVLYGRLHDALTETPLPGGTVHLTWHEPSGVADTTTRRREAQSDGRGMFTFCDPPGGIGLTLGARVLGHQGHPERVLLDGGEMRRQDVRVRFGQIVGEISGVLLDAGTGAPIGSATLTIPELQVSALSDARGRFRLERLAVGDFRTRIRHVAYGSQEVDLDVQPGRTTHLRVELHPRAIALAPLAVTVAVRPRWLEDRGFYERRERGLGAYLGPEELERQDPQRLNEILRRMKGLQLRQVCTPHCFYSILTNGRTHFDLCPPQFYVDGNKTWMPTTSDLDALAHANDVAAVEVYRGISQTPPQFFGKCGSVVIWTKRLES